MVKDTNIWSIWFFSGPEYKTTYLSFALWGDFAGDYWSAAPSRFENIILTISKCDLKKSLQILNIYKTGIDKDLANSILEKYDMSHITIEETDPSPEYSLLF